MADNTEDLQCQLHVQSEYTKKERYKVSDTKTKTMVFNSKSNMENSKFTMNGNIIENVETYKHLGIIRNSKMTNNTKLIEERIQLARNTAYALMGARLHGLNGVNPGVSLSLWKTYIRPWLLYGLESTKLSKPDLLNLEKYQKDFLRRIQHLPERVAMCSVYSLSGLLPIEAEIHRSQ